jgi:hypothetical protein
MAAMVKGKTLDFAQVMHQVREVLERLPDSRRGKNRHYCMADAGVSAFSVFFMQCASFLEYQRRMQQEQGRNNVQSMFGAHEIPSDNQIRNLLDAVPPQVLEPLYEALLEGLMSEGVIERYRTLQGKVLLALDGVTYFSSTTLHCAQCSQRGHRGRTLYSHSAVTPVLVQPGQGKVVALAPEFVTPQDGSAKQDCELNAARRWLQRHGPRWADFGAVVLGDDLYCHEPFCQVLRTQGLDFVLVCKPESHKTTYEWLQMLERRGEVHSMTVRRSNGRQVYLDCYRWAHALPLRDADEALMVDWCELTTTNEAGQVLYRNSWASSLPVTAETVREIVAAGRARWKIENENNNTLKTKGYRFEHNFGHGKQHLSATLASLIVLAYLLHTVLDWLDERFTRLRELIACRQRLFDDMRALTTYCHFPSWSALIEFMIQCLTDGPQPAPAPP